MIGFSALDAMVFLLAINQSWSLMKETNGNEQKGTLPAGYQPPPAEGPNQKHRKYPALPFLIPPVDSEEPVSGLLPTSQPMISEQPQQISEQPQQNAIRGQPPMPFKNPWSHLFPAPMGLLPPSAYPQMMPPPNPPSAPSEDPQMMPPPNPPSAPSEDTQVMPPPNPPSAPAAYPQMMPPPNPFGAYPQMMPPANPQTMSSEPSFSFPHGASEEELPQGLEDFNRGD